MKSLLQLALFIFVAMHARGQSFTSYMVNGMAVVNYKAKAGENMHAIAASFNVPSANILQLNPGLPDAFSHETVIKIPVSGIIAANCEKPDTCFPVYYAVQASEGLYRIGKNHGDVKVSQIKQLNHLASETVSKGQQLLIGFIIVKSATSLIVNPHSDNELARQHIADTTNDDLEAGESERMNALPVKTPAPKKLLADTTMLTYKGSGAFNSAYVSKAIELDVNLAFFKTETGWNDGRFYALIDGVVPGVVVKIFNPASLKTIFAKVVGPLPKVRHAETVGVRVSSAGMVALGLFYEEIYPVHVSY